MFAHQDLSSTQKDNQQIQPTALKITPFYSSNDLLLIAKQLIQMAMFYDPQKTHISHVLARARPGSATLMPCHWPSLAPAIFWVDPSLFVDGIGERFAKWEDYSRIKS